METEQTPFEAMGGREVVERLAHAFYDAMEQSEPELVATHECTPDGRIAPHVRANFAQFLVFWTGGPADYLETRGHPRLRMRHAHVAIGPALRDAWLRSMNTALDRVGVSGAAREHLDARFKHVAHFLQNVEPERA